MNILGLFSYLRISKLRDVDMSTIGEETPVLAYNPATKKFGGVAGGPGGGVSEDDLESAVSAAIASLVDSAPGALNTLNELAAALGDDANFASTVTTALAAKQTASANLTTFAGIAPSANVQTLLAAVNFAAIRSALSLVPGADVQAQSAALAIYAGVSPSANIQSVLGAENYAALRALIRQSPVNLTDAATIVVDATLGEVFRVTLGGNRTLANPTGAYDGQYLMFEIRQDGTGGRTITLGNKFRFCADITACTLSTAASKKDRLFVCYDATDDKFDVLEVLHGH